MYRKSLFLAIPALFVFLFARVCFAAVPQTIQTAQSKISSLIDTGNFTGAQTAVEQMKANFAGNSELPKQLCKIAYKYEQVESFKQAKSLNAQIVTNFPGQDAAKFAGLQLAKLNIYDSIDAGDYKSADAAVSAMTKDFAGNKLLVRRLLEVANRYDKDKAFEYSRRLCKKIVADYPKSEYASYASLILTKLRVYELIDMGDYEAADSVISVMTKKFAGHKQLSRRLYEISHQYTKKGAMSYASRLNSQIADDYPNDEYGVRADFQRKMDAYTTLDDSKIAEIQTGIDKLIVNCNSRPQLASKLPKIILNIAEMSYDKAADANIDQESAKKLLHISADLLEKRVLGKTTGSVLTTANYMLGSNYEKLCEYRKAAIAYKNVYESDPKFKYADYCMFAQGNCYEKLMNNKSISKTEAKPLITSQYNKLLVSYPQSRYATHASQWLQSNQ